MSNQVRNHKWDKNDSILTLYYVKFGLRNLPVKDEKEFAEWVIGSTEASLSMQSMNVRFLLGYDDGVLTDYSQLQADAFEEYNDYSEPDLRVIVDSIIEQRDVKQNIVIAKAKQIQSKRKVWKENSDKSLELALRRMGKDPSKMRKLVRVGK